MTFEGHTDRAPRLLPHREQGEALLTIRGQPRRHPAKRASASSLCPPVRFRGVASTLSRFHRLSRLPAVPDGSTSPSADGPPGAA